MDDLARKRPIAQVKQKNVSREKYKLTLFLIPRLKIKMAIVKLIIADINNQ